MPTRIIISAPPPAITANGCRLRNDVIERQSPFVLNQAAAGAPGDPPERATAQEPQQRPIFVPPSRLDVHDLVICLAFARESAAVADDGTSYDALDDDCDSSICRRLPHDSRSSLKQPTRTWLTLDLSTRTKSSVTAERGPALCKSLASTLGWLDHGADS